MNEDIRDIKPLEVVELPTPIWVWVAIALAALSVAALGAWWWRRRKRAAALPRLPAHEAALAALEALGRHPLGDVEAVRRCYFQLSAVLRTYVEARFGLNATDLTSDEILARLEELPLLSATDRKNLRAFLCDTDRVKFAEHQPDEAEIDEAFARAFDFVRSTKQELQPAA